jgi:hypothetical protein
LMCDISHPHEKCGMMDSGWATNQERNYPKQFCQKIAKLAAKAHVAKPKSKPKPAQDVKKWAGKQARQPKEDLVAEFLTIKTFNNATKEELDEIRLDFKGEVRHCGTALIEWEAKIIEVAEDGSDGSRFSGKIGVYRKPEEFVDLAKKCIHPMDAEIKVPDRIAR